MVLVDGFRIRCVSVYGVVCAVRVWELYDIATHSTDRITIVSFSISHNLGVGGVESEGVILS